MSQETVNQDDTLAKENLITCSNALELGRKVIQRLAGEGFVTSIDERPMEKSEIISLLSAKLNLKLNQSKFNRFATGV